MKNVIAVFVVVALHAASVRARQEEVTLGMGDFVKALQHIDEATFKRLKVQQGYSGGFVSHPGYGQVMRGRTGHAEVLNIVFDPDDTSLESVLDVFWHSHDPTSLHQQGDDIGSQYRSILFFRDAKQNETMHKSMAAYVASATSKSEDAGQEVKPVVTEIVELEKFWPAEENLTDIADMVEAEIREEHAQFIRKYQETKKLKEDGDPNLVEKRLIEAEVKSEEKEYDAAGVDTSDQ
ncbi:Peptide methionine sulfoxide reductase MsrA [Diplonema papillatum]|nr:Peptide methionine sulfoxide reductase MsrA [Diplonema papillatum]